MLRNGFPLLTALLWILQGCSHKEQTAPPASEAGKVNIREFRIDRTEVTVGAYARCVAAGACAPPHENWLACNWRQRQSRAKHPVNCVDWTQAQAFCNWDGGRLPSETEWEYAARGRDDRMYPWGWQPDPTLACVATDGTCEAGSRPNGASPFGLLDMSGNVREWTSGTQMLRGNIEGRVVRGGGWEVDPLAPALKLSVLERVILPASEHAADIGFRCASSQ